MTTAHDAPDLPDAPPATSPRSRDRKRLRPSAPEVRDRRRRWFRYGLLIVSGVLMVNALFGERGYLATVQARQEQQRYEAALHRLRVENANLAEDARRIKMDPQALEEAARRDLGLIRPGETLITIRDRQKD
jgi:cell division protein FtsB